MSQTYSPQSWKKNSERRRKRALKSYRPLSEKTKFTSRRIGELSAWQIFWRKILKFGLLLLGIFIIWFIGATIFYSRELPESTDLLTKNPNISTKIYDRTGEILLNNVNADFRRVKIPLEEIPEQVKWATLVAEDKHFYSHGGIDITGILRSLLSNIFRGTRIGGSSISQQFIKNALLSPEKTYTRKFKELILTWQLERRFTKDEIFEMYLNEIPYGGTAYGIEAAANKYFDKSAKDLDLAEATVLAALPQGPSYYSPYGSRKDKLIARQHWILDSLVEEGYISQAEADDTKAEELEFENISSSILAPHFVFYVRDYIAEKYGEEMLESGGLSVITTLDYNQQKIAEDEVAKGVEKNSAKYNAHNASLVAMKVETGEITAMVGSADYFNQDIDGAVNIATSPRQPGSSFKPLVYSSAFANGYSPETILFDVLTTFKAEPKDYEPHNYNEQYFGPVSMRKALAGSLNIPAVKTMYLVGVENILDMVEQMGYTTFADRSRFGLSVVLGGGEVKLLEHTAGFATLADEGEYKAPLAILEIKDKDGKTLEKNNPNRNKKKRVLDKEVTRQTTSILSDNASRAYVFGESNYLILGDRPVAAKTGTTNDYKDAWTMGYTPQLACGVWVGNARGEKMTGAAAGANVAAPIWNGFMKRVFSETKEDEDAEEVGWKVENFNEPKHQDLPDKLMLNGKLFDSTTEPPYEVHNILYYVNKNNPLGPAPENPWDIDENYNTWETVVEKWADENGYKTEGGSSADDELHTPENQPQIEIISPTSGVSISDLISITISASAKRGVSRVEYYLDNTKIATQNSTPFNLNNFKPIGFSNGNHTLKAVAFDDVDNSASAEISVSLNLPASYTNSVSILIPQNNTILVDESFPAPVKISISNFEYYTKADFYITNSSGSKWIGWREIKLNEEVLTWSEKPAPGNYELYILLTDKFGRSVESERISISIK